MTDRSVFASRLWTVTVAWAKANPLGSRVVPRRSPKVDWACARCSMKHVDKIVILSTFWVIASLVCAARYGKDVKMASARPCFMSSLRRLYETLILRRRFGLADLNPDDFLMASLRIHQVRPLS